MRMRMCYRSSSSLMTQSNFSRKNPAFTPWPCFVCDTHRLWAGQSQTWIMRSEIGQRFGLGCRVCKAYAQAHGKEVNEKHQVYVECRVGTCRPEGPKRKLQLEELLRHGGTSKSKQKSKLHQKALRWIVGCDPSADLQPGDSEHSAQLDANQLRISCMVMRSSLAAQGLEYDRRATEASRTIFFP